jgi:hypothetical protein
VNDDELFLRTLQDLHSRVESGDEYSLVRATALLRQLLLDDTRLVDRVNQTHRLRLRFEVCGRPYAEVVLQLSPAFYSRLGGIHKSGPFPHQMEALSRDDFLKTTVLFLDARRITIGDLITYAANVAGGVHTGNPRTDEQKVLANFREVIMVDHPVQIAQLAAVIKIVLDALEPLRQAVAAGQLS